MKLLDKIKYLSELIQDTLRDPGCSKADKTVIARWLRDKRNKIEEEESDINEEEK